MCIVQLRNTFFFNSNSYECEYISNLFSPKNVVERDSDPSKILHYKKNSCIQNVTGVKIKKYYYYIIFKSYH